MIYVIMFIMIFLVFIYHFPQDIGCITTT